MFTKGQQVEVYFIHPGQYEHLWHRAAIVEKVEQSDSYKVLVGSVPAQIKTTDIRKV